MLLGTMSTIEYPKPARTVSPSTSSSSASASSARSPPSPTDTTRGGSMGEASRSKEGPSSPHGPGPRPSNPDSREQQENAFLVLLRVSFLVPPFSLLAALYTLLILLFLTLSAPLRLFPSFFHPPSLHHFLLPLLHSHQRLITTVRPQNHHHPYHHHHTSEPDLSALRICTIHLLSPLLVLPLLFIAWITAFFWLFAMILGDPDGTERGDDGRTAVLGVRNWWRIWLGRTRVEPFRERRRREKKRGRRREMMEAV